MTSGLRFTVHNRNHKTLDKNLPLLATIGNFDGVHRGHQSILKRVVERAAERSCCSVAITFDPHPTKFLRPDKAKEELTTLPEKIRLLLETGIDFVVVLEFNDWLANLGAVAFCEKALTEQFLIRELVVGYDFHFGKNREGNFEFLLKYFSEKNIAVEKVEAVVEPQSGLVISSSRIRELIKTGEMRLAAACLGRYYSLNGHIVAGDAKGREIGFPTANLRWENELVPKIGIYACWVELEKKDSVRQLLPGVLSCGYRPIMGRDLRLQVEAHIFDFSRNIYNLPSRFYFVEFLRDELPFTNWQALAAQIQLDCEQARKILLAEKIAD